MRAACLGVCVLALGCGHGGVGSLATLKHPSITPGARLRLVGFWGRAIWDGRGTRAVAFMPDGKTAVAAGDEIVVFDVATRTPLRRFKGHKNSIGSVAVSPDGKSIATGGFVDRTIAFWDAATGVRLRAIEIPEDRSVIQTVSGLAYAPDGRHLVASTADQRLAVYDAGSGATVWTGSFTLGPAGPVDAAFSPDGKLVAAASGMGGVAVWDAATGQQLWHAEHHATGVAFQDGKLAAVGDSPALVIYDARTGAVAGERRFDGHPEAVAAVPGQPGRFVVADPMSGSAVTILDGRGATQMHGHLDGVHGVVVSPDGRWAVSVALHDGVRVWDLAQRTEALLDGHDAYVVALAPSADGQRLTSIAGDGSILVWSVANGTILSRRQGPRAPIIAAAFSADGDVAVISAEVPEMWPDETGPGVFLVDGRTARVRAQLDVRFQPVDQLGMSPDGRTSVAYGSGFVSRYDLTRPTSEGKVPPVVGEQILDMRGGVQAIAPLAHSDLAMITGAKWRTWHDGDIEVNGIVGRVDAGGKLAWSLDGGVMTRLAVARDGSVGFAGDRDGVLTMVDLGTGKLRWPRSMSPPSGSAITAVALSPDAHLAASAGAAGDLCLRNADTGALLDTAQLKSAAMALAFAPDGLSLYAGDAAGVVFRFAL
jgi:WD40 repeat protein